MPAWTLGSSSCFHERDGPPDLELGPQAPSWAPRPCAGRAACWAVNKDDASRGADAQLGGPWRLSLGSLKQH